MLRQLKRFLYDSEGATAVEYAIMLALIVIVCLASITTLGLNNAASFQDSSDQMAASGLGG
jgi:pilus assembly protein Flp/PilA